MYGILVGKLKLNPSEVRRMTLGEAYAIIDAIADNQPRTDFEELYQLGKIKGIFGGDNSKD
jgi:hypothetical protein